MWLSDLFSNVEMAWKNLLFVMLCLGFAGTTLWDLGRASADDQAYSFDKPPYIYPGIIYAMTRPLFGDGESQEESIDLTEPHCSDCYEVRSIEGGNPYVFLRYDDKSFDYRYIGQTEDGVHVLHTSYWGGGSGVFKDLMLVTIEEDSERLLIRKLGEITLGDRWSGELSVTGNEIFVGKDKGWFTVSGGTGGSLLTNDPRDRVITITYDGESISCEGERHLFLSQDMIAVEPDRLLCETLARWSDENLAVEGSQTEGERIGRGQEQEGGR